MFYSSVIIISFFLFFLFFDFTQYLEVREKQYDKKAYVDFFTVSFECRYIC